MQHDFESSTAFQRGLEPSGIVVRAPVAARRWLVWPQAALWSLVLGSLLCSAGCLNWFPQQVISPEAAFAPLPLNQNNPTLITNQNRELVFETVVDVVDDYFKVEREVPVRLEGDVLVEGQVETYPRGGSTLLEPWNRDSVNYYEKLESTLQSIRRRAIVRVIPAEAGFLVDVAVFKELEDVARPENGSASRAANLRNDNSLRRYVDPVGGQQPTIGWIPLGRDVALEQQMIAQLQSRFGCVAPLAGAVQTGSAPPEGAPMLVPPGMVPGGAPGAGPPGYGLPPGMIAPESTPSYTAPPTQVPLDGASPFGVPPGAAPPLQ